MSEPIRTDVGDFLKDAVIWIVLIFVVIPAIVGAIIQYESEHTGKVVQPLPPGYKATTTTMQVDQPVDSWQEQAAKKQFWDSMRPR